MSEDILEILIRLEKYAEGGCSPVSIGRSHLSAAAAEIRYWRKLTNEVRQAHIDTRARLEQVKKKLELVMTPLDSDGAHIVRHSRNWWIVKEAIAILREVV